MRKKELSLVVAVVIFIFIMWGIHGGYSLSENKIDSKIKEEVNAGGEARVFINLKSNESEGAKKDIAEDIGEEKVKFVFEDSISAVINKEDIKQLEKDKRVESVRPVGIRQVSLDDSVPLINGTTTWRLQVNGINLTGAGQTICIIDSGVNYSHPDLGGCYGNNNLSSNCKIWGGWDYCADDVDCSTNDWNPMDIHGHGTHVSGIAAANGTVNGVAPQSRIIMIKACNSTGSCFDDAIKSGINWCVNNASRYNISVISMSLGGGLYSNYCNSDDLASNINNAVGAGIPVVIATGNDGSTTQIAAPACVQNATPVGSIRKDDSTIDYNRNSLLKLLAPGVSIYSTYLSTKYATASGTSMSTPHVAGAIAIIKQFLNSTRQSKTPKEIEAVLNNSGKRIYDSANGLNFSRINIYDSIISLDNGNPNVVLVSPSNNSISSSVNQAFRCNATDLALKNITFYLWNSSGVFNVTNKNIAEAFNLVEINITNMANGDYEWNCLFYDERGNKGFAAANFSLTIRGVSVNLLSPNNGDYTNLNETNFSCQVLSETNYGLSNATFYLWNSSALIYNETKSVSGVSNISAFNYTFKYENNYKWNCLGTNNVSNSSFGNVNFSIVFDASKPQVDLVSPIDGYSVDAGEIVFKYNASDNVNISRCELILNTGGVASNSSRITYEINNISYSVSPGNYNWSMNCTDLAGNMGNSSLRSLTVNAVSTSVTSGSSGGGSIVSSETYKINSEQTSQGYTRDLSKNDKIIFEIFDENFANYTLSVDYIGNNFVNLSIRKGPIYVMLGIGQSVKLNLSSPNYYNLYVKLESITAGKAKLTIQSIHDPIIKEVIGGDEEKTGGVGDNESRGTRELFEEGKENGKSLNVGYVTGAFVLFAVILIVVIALLIWFIYFKSKKEIKEEIKEEVQKELRKRKLKKSKPTE